MNRFPSLYEGRQPGHAVERQPVQTVEASPTVAAPRLTHGTAPAQTPIPTRQSGRPSPAQSVAGGVRGVAPPPGRVIPPQGGSGTAPVQSVAVHRGEAPRPAPVGVHRSEPAAVVPLRERPTTAATPAEKPGAVSSTPAEKAAAVATRADRREWTVPTPQVRPTERPTIRELPTVGRGAAPVQNVGFSLREPTPATADGLPPRPESDGPAPPMTPTIIPTVAFWDSSKIVYRDGPAIHRANFG